MKKGILFMTIGAIFAAVLTVLDLMLIVCPKSDKFLLAANLIVIGAMLLIFSYGLKLYRKSKKVARTTKRRH
jgi:hypothetical protein